MKGSARERNRRGEGARLRDDILAAATDLIEATDSAEAVTLRAVAREVGISAPSIYQHFPDREAIVDAVIDDAFDAFNAAIRAGVRDTGKRPAARLMAGCAAYVRFAAERPSQYRLLFDRKHFHATDDPVPAIRKESFEMLVRTLQECVDAGESASDDPFSDAVAIWVALHGYAALRAQVPMFPWPPEQEMLARIVYGPAKISGDEA